MMLSLLSTDDAPVDRNERYVQCSLQQNETGKCQITWLPEHFAEVGKVLRLRDNKRGTWSVGWVVLTVYDGAEDYNGNWTRINAHRNFRWADRTRWRRLPVLALGRNHSPIFRRKGK